MRHEVLISQLFEVLVGVVYQFGPSQASFSPFSFYVMAKLSFVKLAKIS